MILKLKNFIQICKFWSETPKNPTFRHISALKNLNFDLKTKNCHLKSESFGLKPRKNVTFWSPTTKTLTQKSIFFLNRNRDERSIGEMSALVSPMAIDGASTEAPATSSEAPPASSTEAAEEPVVAAVEAAAAEEQDLAAAVITGMRVEDVEKGVSYDDGATVVLAGVPVTLHYILIQSMLLINSFNYVFMSKFGFSSFFFFFFFGFMKNFYWLSIIIKKTSITF